jgi:hypothetical protein
MCSRNRTSQQLFVGPLSYLGTWVALSSCLASQYCHRLPSFCSSLKTLKNSISMANAKYAFLPLLACVLLQATHQVGANDNTWVSNQSSKGIMASITYSFGGDPKFINREITAGNAGEYCSTARVLLILFQDLPYLCTLVTIRLR